VGGNYVEILPGGLPLALAAGAGMQFPPGAVSLIGLLSKFVGGNEDDGS